MPPHPFIWNMNQIQFPKSQVHFWNTIQQAQKQSNLKWYTGVRIKTRLQLTFSQSNCLGVKSLLWFMTLSLINFETYITTTLWVSSLMRQQVCHLLKTALTVMEAWTNILNCVDFCYNPRAFTIWSISYNELQTLISSQTVYMILMHSKVLLKKLLKSTSLYFC